MRHTTRVERAISEYSYNAKYNLGRYTPRCKYCNNIIEIGNLHVDICVNCQIERKEEQRKRQLANGKRSRSGLLGTLKQRIVSALQRTIKNGNRKWEKSDLTMTFLLELYDRQKGKCALSGRNLSLGSVELNKYDNNVISIDRIDSTRGYTKENVQFVTYQVNIAKGRHSNTEFLELCQDVIKNCAEEQSKK